MPLERLDLIQEKVCSLVREVESLREENAELHARISTLHKKMKENKKRLEHVLVSENDIKKLHLERQQVHEKLSCMLNQLKDI
ncbi:cell division protein ZapB [bacterium]|nr:cell division protein ZapB [bacterium]